MEKREITLESLIGLHTLSGAEIFTEQIKHPYFEDESFDGTVFLFRLDNKNYVAMEDSNDGYRSAMESLQITRRKIKNQFAPVKVFGLYKDRSASGYNSASIIQFYDLKTAKLVLEVGTDSTDDYYPSFVCVFYPENMAVNLLTTK